MNFVKGSAGRTDNKNLNSEGGIDMPVWKFTIQEDMVRYGDKQRKKITRKGCNEPYKGRYWCPKAMWFRKEICPFVNRKECENFVMMCGCL